MAENRERSEQEFLQTEKYTKIIDFEAGIKEPLSREVTTWMEKVEQSQIPTQTINDNSGQPILMPSAPVNPKIILPVTKRAFVQGFKKTIEQAGRWLSVFILRLIKIKGGNVKFKLEE